MIGASRTSIGELHEAVAARFDAGSSEQLAADGQSLLSFSALLGRERILRQTVADPALDAGAKRATLLHLLQGKVEQGAFDLIALAASLRWSTDRDLVHAIDEAGQSLLLMAAERDGRLDRVEEEVFRFERAISANPDLQMALTDPATPAETKTAIVGQLLDEKADPISVRLLKDATVQLHGRPIQTAVSSLSALAAQRRGRIVADVRSAIALTEEQQGRLAAALGRLHGREVQLNVNVDPDVIGGLEVRVGDEVIDGTMATRLEAARRRLTH